MSQSFVIPHDLELQDAEKTSLKFIPVDKGFTGASSEDKYLSVFRITLKKDEDGRYVATCQDLQGVVTDGKTEDEAMKNAFEAIQAMLESIGRKSEQFILIQN
ncbi:MAG: type II toxin-antitoxin system HicB family antitoxin [Nitrosarchaeum sp.]|nr:type II toxin-antitoxin system HicB family antitoxin [Nitrosarchaeum sp.]